MPSLLPGSPHPLGATLVENGVNFALYSETATGVDVCLFDDQGVETRVKLPQRTAFVWHGLVTGIGAGQRYGYRVSGPYEPERGLRFNPNVVLLDPYARAVDGPERWDAGCFAYDEGDDRRMRTIDALGAPRGVVVDPAFDWEGDVRPRTALHRTVIYEAHVRGLTKLHPEIPERMRGTYAAIAHPAIIRHLQELGITAIELMPVHAFTDDKMLVDKGLRNYWGYSTIGYFAPDVRYREGAGVGDEVKQFKEMVKALHRAGIEVILDVVYNHTAEGNHLGPTLSLKGIDNATYYRLVGGEPRFYFDYTGTGNTLNVRHPQVLALIMDSLRYWASEMHVDGFRFDLASALARQLHEVDRLSSFFTLIHDSPTLRDLKIIAEPWDVGEGGYQVGNFPVRWAEWNGRYRDAVRSFWKGESGKIGEVGQRLAGSSDLYEAGGGRAPSASVNFLTAHDGFTLSDWASYDHKHNDANGENNADGNDSEHSWNCGAEGPTTDAGVKALRARQRRNMLATLLLSQGTPMILAGDEMGRTQRGNNNAYCQDNEISWVDWELDAERRAQLELVRRLVSIRRAHPALHRAHFFRGRSIHGTDLVDLDWFRNDGRRMTEEDWSQTSAQCLGMFMAGRALDDVDDRGRPLVDDNLLVLLNASHLDLDFAMPRLEGVKDEWELLVDTAADRASERVPASGATRIVGRSLKVYRSVSRVVRVGAAIHAPGTTYRVQLGGPVGFREVTALLDHLGALGVSDLYLSPIFAPSKGSTHGYDVVDHARINEALGGEEAFVALADAAHARKIGIVIDWVPNHMGIDSGENAYWQDVLENGPSSRYAEMFDIDWSPAKEELRDTVLLPVLGEQYGDALEGGKLRLIRDRGTFFLTYYDRRFPIGPRSLRPFLAEAAAATGLAEDDPARLELESIQEALGFLPNRQDNSADARKARGRDKEILKRRLGDLLESAPAIATTIDATLARYAGEPGVATSFDPLDRILRDQSYRLASWRVAAQEINYRRFFDVNDLAAIRMEEAAVFDRAHATLVRLIDEKKIDALRLDHTDGLYDPLAYFELLQQRVKRPAALPDESPDDLARPLALYVEKILEPGEKLPAGWPVDGTTGYELGASVVGLWVDGASEAAFTAMLREVTGDPRSFSDHVYEAKLRVLREALPSELNMLARRLERIAGANRHWRDFTLIALTRALVETIAAFPVYRTYLREGEAPTENDVRRVRVAARIARIRTPDVDASVFKFLEDVLLLRTEGSDEARRAHVGFALRFQQITGPVMAKAVEDTAFYRYPRLLCLNEVGGDPGAFGGTVETFHAASLERLRSWPLSMTTMSTHDSKRGEDAAARIAVLSELPAAWERESARWRELGLPYRGASGGNGAASSERVVPTPRDELTFHQALVGAWPCGWDGGQGRDAFADRMAAYMWKVAKEAKIETSWAQPDLGYEEALRAFVQGALHDDAFLAAVRAFSDRIGVHGASNGLGQVVLHMAAPGVPDTYQGTELWNQALVDPDNRAPVDFDRVRRVIAGLGENERDPSERARRLRASWTTGAIKAHCLREALRTRAAKRDVLLRGDYAPLATDEPHVVAFARTLRGERVVAAVTRFPVRLVGDGPSWAIGRAWGARRITIPEGRHRDVLTGRRVGGGAIDLADLFAELPVALLVDDAGPGGGG